MISKGTIIGGKYRLNEEIGRGGMGSVWRAENMSWDAPVALKLMDPSMIQNSDALIRFEREARLAAGLRSPHVVQILDHGVDETTNVPYLAMELLEGSSLAQRIAAQGKLSAQETAVLINQVGRALTKAHDAGIVHRDLKPDNIFLVENHGDLLAKVLDFGIAKWDSANAGSALTRPGSVVGTPFYMSPEQVRGSLDVDHRSDLWSLGVIACECLTGRRPFESPDFVELAMAICEGRGRLAPSELGTVPNGFDAWFARGAAIRPADRYSSAHELVQELMVVCETSSSIQPPVHPRFNQTIVEVLPSVSPLSITDSSSQPDSSLPTRSSKKTVAVAFATAGLLTLAAVVALVFSENLPLVRSSAASVSMQTLEKAPKVKGSATLAPVPSGKPALTPQPALTPEPALTPVPSSTSPKAEQAPKVEQRVPDRTVENALFVKRARRPKGAQAPRRKRTHRSSKARKPPARKTVQQKPTSSPTTSTRAAESAAPSVNGRRVRTSL